MDIRARIAAGGQAIAAMHDRHDEHTAQLIADQQGNGQPVSGTGATTEGGVRHVEGK